MGINKKLEKESIDIRREYYREYYKKNKEKVKEYQKRFWDKKALNENKEEKNDERAL